MASLNRWQGIGRLGKDPEVRNLDNGSTVANFSIACTESYKDRTTGEKKEVTEWINCVAWKGVADIASKYLRKGDLTFLEGKLKTRQYEQNNTTKYITEVVVDSITLLGSRNNSRNAEVNGNVSHTTSAARSNSSDDLPF